MHVVPMLLALSTLTAAKKEQPEPPPAPPQEYALQSSPPILQKDDWRLDRRARRKAGRYGG